MSVQPIPEGFRTVTPHMVIKGCAEAIEFYKKAFDAKECMRMPGPGGSVMHAELDIGDTRIMMADEFPQGPGGPLAPPSLNGTSVILHLFVDDAEAWWKRAVDAGAEGVMPVMEMFWGDKYGQVQDPYGHRWGLATHLKDMTPEEIAAAGEAFMAQMAEGGGCEPS